MIKVGLTGGICSGKSTISSMIKEAGIPVIDADIIAREVLEKYPDILLRVRATFHQVTAGYVKSGNVNRANSQWIYTTGPITIKMMDDDNVVRLNGKKYTDAKIKLRRNQKLVVDKLVHIKSLDTSDPALFYHIKGTKNDWVMAEAVTNTSFQMGVTEER